MNSQPQNVTDKIEFDLYKVVKKLSCDDVGRNNFYKFFLPYTINLTIEIFELTCMPEELVEA